MSEIVRSGQWQPGGKSAFEIVGKDHGAAVTLILEDMPKGGGPRLHRHPYGEVWVVTGGHADFTAGERVIPASTGDVIYVEAGLPHKFVSTGDEPLRMVCIHQSPHFATEWLE